MVTIKGFDRESFFAVFELRDRGWVDVLPDFFFKVYLVLETSFVMSVHVLLYPFGAQEPGERLRRLTVGKQISHLMQQAKRHVREWCDLMKVVVLVIGFYCKLVEQVLKLISVKGVFDFYWNYPVSSHRCELVLGKQALAQNVLLIGIK